MWHIIHNCFASFRLGEFLNLLMVSTKKHTPFELVRTYIVQEVLYGYTTTPIFTF